MPTDPTRRPTPVRRVRGEAGEVTSTVFVMPIVLTLILVVVQLGLAWHAKTIVNAAASDGLAATQVDGSTSEAGDDAVRNMLAGSTDQLLSDVTVTVDRHGDTSTVHIEARVANVVPLLPIYVHATASGPTERFRPN